MKLRPAVTAVVAVPAPLGLDELPQSVQRAPRRHKSLVGPRRCRKRATSTASPDWHRKRYLACPGLTGCGVVPAPPRSRLDDSCGSTSSSLENFLCFPTSASC